MQLFPTRIRALAALALSLSSAAFAAEQTAKPASDGAEQKYLLRYKFAAGEILRYDVRQSDSVRATIKETTERSQSHADSVKAWKVTDVLPNGDMEFVYLVEWMKMIQERPGGQLVYDSRTDATPPRGFEQVARSAGVPLSLIRIDATGKVTSREEKSPHEVRDDLPIAFLLPEHAVAAGDKWEHPYEVTTQRGSGVNTVVKTRRVSKLREVTNGVALIDVEYQALTPMDPSVRANVIDRLTKGLVRFDIAQGRIISQEHNVDGRVIGYRGEASSYHRVSRFEEKLIASRDEPGKIQQTSANITP